WCQVSPMRWRMSDTTSPTAGLPRKKPTGRWRSSTGRRRGRLRWAVRIIPVRKDPQGNEIRLTEILDPIDKISLQQVGDAIKAKDGRRFVETYKQMLDSCYACHLAAGKPYLRLHIPELPAAPIINFAKEQ